MALNYTSDRPTFPEPHLHVSFPFFFPSLPLSLSVCYMSLCLIQFSVFPFLFLTHSLIPLYLGLSLILSISLSHCLSICICLSDCLYLSLSLSGLSTHQ